MEYVLILSDCTVHTDQTIISLLVWIVRSLLTYISQRFSGYHHVEMFGFWVTVPGSRQSSTWVSWTTILMSYGLEFKRFCWKSLCTHYTNLMPYFCSHLQTARLKLCHHSAYISLSLRLAAGTDGGVSNPAIITTFRKQTFLFQTLPILSGCRHRHSRLYSEFS